MGSAPRHDPPAVDGLPRGISHSTRPPRPGTVGSCFNLRECHPTSVRRPDHEDELPCPAPFAERPPWREHVPALPRRRCCAVSAIRRYCRCSAVGHWAGRARPAGEAFSSEAPLPYAQTAGVGMLRTPLRSPRALAWVGFAWSPGADVSSRASWLALGIRSWTVCADATGQRKSAHRSAGMPIGERQNREDTPPQV